MVDYLTHYYLSDQQPFQSLSALPDEEALKIMAKLSDDTAFGERFKNPGQYLHNRRETERWVREGFAEKGGVPQETYPVAMALGSSKWLVHNAPDPDRHAEIRIPLSIFTEFDVSFTYPDSMISRWFGLEKPAAYYQPDLHGVIFTLHEILSIVERMGMPEEDWDAKLPGHLAPYIEAQVWRHQPLMEYLKRLKAEDTQQPAG